MNRKKNTNRDRRRPNRKGLICMVVAFCTLFLSLSVTVVFPQNVKDYVRKWQYRTANTGSVVTFGRYEQDGNLNNGAEDIQWIVLARNGNNILLISKYSLLSSNYVEWSNFWEYYENNAELDTTWANSVPRSVLNESFYYEAFTEAERKRIILTTVVPDKDTDGKTNSEPNTQDHIFILSESEAIKYFQNDNTRKSNVTKYMLKSNEMKAYFSEWWLRSSAERETCLLTVSGEGSILRRGRSITSEWDIRPVLWLYVD